MPSNTAIASRAAPVLDILHTTDAEGAPLCWVPLAQGRQGFCTIDEPDLQLLETLGLWLGWYLVSKKFVVAPCFGASGKTLLVARVLLDAGPGEAVTYKDQDFTNLRRSNLELLQGRQGRRRDRDFITPWPEKRELKQKARVHVYA